MSEDRRQQIYDDIHSRAVAFETNTVVRGEPTLTGWLHVVLEEILDLRVRLEALEQG